MQHEPPGGFLNKVAVCNSTTHEVKQSTVVDTPSWHSQAPVHITMYYRVEQDACIDQK